MIEIPVPLKDGIYFYLKIPAGKQLKKRHFEQFKRYVDYLESAMASDEDEQPAPPAPGATSRADDR